MLARLMECLGVLTRGGLVLSNVYAHDGSSMRLIAPLIHADERWTMKE